MRVGGKEGASKEGKSERGLVSSGGRYTNTNLLSGYKLILHLVIGERERERE